MHEKGCQRSPLAEAVNVLLCSSLSNEVILYIYLLAFTKEPTSSLLLPEQLKGKIPGQQGSVVCCTCRLPWPCRAACCRGIRASKNFRVQKVLGSSLGKGIHDLLKLKH